MSAGFRFLDKQTQVLFMLGLTGGIATGKSTVSSLLQSRYGIPVIDADVLARQVVEPGTPAYSQIVAYFGKEVLKPDGALDRQKLGQIIFNETEKRHKLNSIVHPAVTRAMLLGVIRCWLTGHRLCVLDVPLLIEAGIWKWVGKVILVYCSSDIQLERLMRRDQSNSETAISRLKSQMPTDEKVGYADDILDNNGDETTLDKNVEALVRTLLRQVGWSWRLSWLCPPLGVAFALRSLLMRTWKRRYTLN